jgi:hypothetical protein
MATMGGAKALKLENDTGSFAVGKCFDAILVDVDRGNNLVVSDRDTPMDVFQRPFTTQTTAISPGSSSKTKWFMRARRCGEVVPFSRGKTRVQMKFMLSSCLASFTIRCSSTNIQTTSLDVTNEERNGGCASKHRSFRQITFLAGVRTYDHKRARHALQRLVVVHLFVQPAQSFVLELCLASNCHLNESNDCLGILTSTWERFTRGHCVDEREERVAGTPVRVLTKGGQGRETRSLVFAIANHAGAPYFDLVVC